MTEQEPLIPPIWGELADKAWQNQYLCQSAQAPKDSILAGEVNPTIELGLYTMCTPMDVQSPGSYTVPTAPDPKHDGDLGSHLGGTLAIEIFTLTFSKKQMISLYMPPNAHRDKKTRLANFTPVQALSLLTWLQQEKPELERLVKEQEG